MSTFQGRRGYLALGGVLVSGVHRVKGNVAQGATTATIWSGGGLSARGVILPGDIFTVAGDATEYTVVTGGAFTYNAGADSWDVTITFTPGVQPAGGWDGASVFTLAANKIVEVRDWSATTERVRLDRGVLGDKSKRYEFGMLDWRGRATALFDYDDPNQAQAVDETTASNPSTVGLVLAMDSGVIEPRLFYGVAHVEQFRTESTRESLITAEFDFQGSAAKGLAIDW